MSQREYTAFISYRHAPKDSAVAKLLHTMIEQYRIPKDLQKDGRSRLGIVFRDQEELHASSDLSAEIRKVLDHAEFLIVICSENTGQSRWVPQEIDYFLSKHDRSHVLILLAGGEPSQVMPYQLTHITDQQTGEVREVEPLAADVRADSIAAIKRKLRRELPRLVAPILGCPYDGLVMREQKRKTRRLLTAAAAVLTVATTFSTVLLMKNRQIEAQNQELISQKAQIQWQESELLAENAEEALANGYIRDALELSLAAIPDASGQAVHPQAQSVLMRSLNLFGNEDNSNTLNVTELAQSTFIKNFQISGDGTKVVTMDEYRQINCFDKETGALLWSHQAPTVSDYSITTMYPIIFVDPIHDAVICCQDDRIESLELETGALRWYIEEGYPYRWDNQSICFCPQTGMLAFVRIERLGDGYRLSLELVNAGSGITEDRIELESVQEWVSFPSVDTETVGAFSADGRYFTGAYNLDSGKLHIYTVDLSSGTLLHQYECDTVGYLGARSIGMGYSADTEAIFAAFSKLKEDVPVTVLKISVQTGELLWASDLPGSLLNRTSPQVLFCDESILVGSANQLYSIDTATGTIENSMSITGNIKSMTVVGEREFCMSLDNGTCILGWQFDDGSLRTSSETVGLYATVGQHELFRCWGGGIVQMKGDWLAISNDSSPGFVAVQPRYQRNIIQIYQPVTLASVVEQESLLPADVMLAFGSDANMMRCGEQILIWPVQYYDQADADGYGEEHFLTIDVTTGTLERTRIPEDFVGHTIWWFSDGSGYYADHFGYDGYLIRDGAEPVKVPEGDEGDGFIGRIYMDCVYLNGNGPLLTAFCRGDELSWWIDGVPAQTIPIPMILQYTSWENRYLTAGENGLIILRQEDESGVERLAVCNITEGKWVVPEMQIPVQFDTAAFAVHQPLVATADEEGNIHILDITTGSELLQFPSGVSPLSIGQLQFILEDEILMLCTEDELLRLYDLKDGAVKFSTFLSDDFAVGRSSVWMDKENQRLYLTNGEFGMDSIGLCVDIQNWGGLTFVPGLLFFDEQTGEVYQYTDGGPSGSIFSRFRVPGTAELYRLGSEALAQMDPAQP